MIYNIYPFLFFSVLSAFCFQLPLLYHHLQLLLDKQGVQRIQTISLTVSIGKEFSFLYSILRPGANWLSMPSTQSRLFQLQHYQTWINLCFYTRGWHLFFGLRSVFLHSKICRKQENSIWPVVPKKLNIFIFTTHNFLRIMIFNKYII